MTIRLATASDAALLTELAVTTLRAAFGPPHNPAELVEEYIQSAITQPIIEAELADIRSTFFMMELPDGQLLMQHCLDWAYRKGYKVVWLGVWERNERALRFYEKLGFQRFGFHYFQFGSERQRDFWLQKQL